uniref:Alpha-tocopherol transfer protein-like n=1 Tax=Cacopsylla melanoneura TaxID=428564 RepID=A0A8D8QMH1_9HEMI
MTSAVDTSEVFLSQIKESPTFKKDNFIVTLELQDPSPELQEIARNELRELPEIVQPAIDELRALLKEDEEITCPHENNAWLVRFLRPTKFYPESAHKLIKNYYSFKVKHKDLYNGLKPSKEENVFHHNVLYVLPLRDNKGRRILVLELGKNWKHKKVCLDEVFKGAVLFLEAAMLEPTSQIAGAQVIFDMDGLSLQQAWQFTPTFAKRIVDWLQDSVPIRVKGIHVVNQPTIFNMVFALFKPLLREKLKNRIIFHGTDRDSLHKHLNPECLPETYKGTMDIPLVTGEEWLSVLKTMDEEYEAISQYGFKSKPKK